MKKLIIATLTPVILFAHSANAQASNEDKCNRGDGRRQCNEMVKATKKPAPKSDECSDNRGRGRRDCPKTPPKSPAKK